MQMKEVPNSTRDIPADLVVFAGGSAGGIGVFNNVDFVQTSLPNVPVLGMFTPVLIGYLEVLIGCYVLPNASLFSVCSH